MVAAILPLTGSDTDDIPIRWKSKSKCNGKSTIMFVSEEYLKLIDELYRLKRVEAISLVSVSIKDTIIIKLNNALSTLIAVDVELWIYSACKSQCKPCSD